MKEIKDIQRQIDEMRCTLREPRYIYMNRKTFNAIDKYMESMARYPNSLPTITMKLFGIEVKIHNDFPEPKVC